MPPDAETLDVLREVDRHFQKLTGVDVPGAHAVEHFTDFAGRPRSRTTLIDGEHYDLWRRVRAAIRELENGRPSGSAERHPGTACGPRPASDAAIPAAINEGEAS